MDDFRGIYHYINYISPFMETSNLQSPIGLPILLCSQPDQKMLDVRHVARQVTALTQLFFTSVPILSVTMSVKENH